MEYQDKCSELEEIVDSLSILINEITDTYYIDILSDVKQEAQYEDLRKVNVSEWVEKRDGTAVKIVIDDEEFIQRGPVMNGSNPVKDNSMSQQRLWNCQTRLFVKGVAIWKGLGFDLWIKEELRNAKDSWEDDLDKHNIFKIKERIEQLYTKVHKTGLSAKEIAERLHRTEDEVKSIFTYFDTLNNFERDLANIDTKSR